MKRKQWKAVTVMIELVLYLRGSKVQRVLCKDFLRPRVRGLQCWAQSLHPADRQVLNKIGLKDETVTFAARLSTPL